MMRWNFVFFNPRRGMIPAALMIASMLLFPCWNTAVAAENTSSLIVDVEGTAREQAGETEEQTKERALTDARATAARVAEEYMRERFGGGSAENEELAGLYANGTVKILSEKSAGWVKAPSSEKGQEGEFRVRVSAEVIPQAAPAQPAGQTRSLGENENAPLEVKVWPAKEDYQAGEEVKLFLQGNKPFYALIVYKDAAGNYMQLLPNKHRSNNHFEGGVVYEIPSSGDQYKLEVTPPLGEESIKAYASTVPVGNLEITPAGPIYKVQTPVMEMEVQVRGLNRGAGGEDVEPPVEFAEAAAPIHTAK